MRIAIVIMLISVALVGGAAFAQGRTGNDTEEEQAFQSAESAFNANRYDEAAPLYEKVTAINPGRAEPWVKRAVILYRKKQYTDAVKLLRAAQSTLPSDLGIKAQLGLSLYRGGAPEMAVAMMEEVVAQKPEMPELQLQLALHYVKLGDGKRAVAAIEYYFKSRPAEAAREDGQLRPLAGTAYLLNKQYEQAEREFEAVLKQSPNDVVARVSLGQVFTGKGDCQKAITLYERVLAEAPKRPFIHADLATCYLKIGRRAEALRSAEAYNALRPREGRGFVLLGDARAETRDLPGALTAYEQAKKLDPRVTVDGKMGKVFLGQKNYAGAAAMLETAAKASPDDVEIQTQLAEAYAATRQPKEKLVEIADRLLKSTDAEALTAAGVALYAAAEDARAEKAFTAALKADAKARRARTGLQMALYRVAFVEIGKSNLAAAEAALTRAHDLDPDSIQGNRNLGLVLLLTKKWAEAEKVLLLAQKRVPNDLVVNRLLGRAFLGMKRQADALKVYEASAQVALRSRGPALAEIYAELGPAYVEAGRFDQAVAVLETAVKEAGQTPALAASQRNLAVACYRRGLSRLADPKQADGALEDLLKAAAIPRPALAPKELAAVSCAAALAALQAGKPAQAKESLALATREGGCAFKPPFEKVGAEFFTAYAQYREASPERREEAAMTFQKLQPKATGTLAALLKALVRSSYELQGYDLYQRSDEKRASVALKAAARLGLKGEHRELDHNLAVIEVTEGRYVAAEKQFEELGTRPPEAAVNLGILVDRQGDAKRALELYKRGAERGARAPKLREWIDVKERLLGGAQGGAK
ncbi:MAG: tetratricopeptide repeat protein [Myxococcales bacterium]|nr:tetratricopeptide repeat protein [Myxococcales bacterium]